MNLKEFIRAGESGGRKSAVREQLLPSYLPLPRPTRDISASNRSHSITHEEPPHFQSERRFLLLEREAEEFQYEKQANVIYTRQFKSLAKLLGNETMEFDDIRDKIEGLILKDHMPSQETILHQKIHQLERELAKTVIASQTAVRSGHSLGNTDYIKSLENQMGRKSKLITQLSDSIKREAFEDAYRQLKGEVSEKSIALRLLEDQAQQARLKSSAHISTLEEELVKHKQTIQKLTFQLDTLKRKAQSHAQQVQRSRKRERELSNSFEVETKANYQGITYGINALLLQLQARDNQLQNLADHEAQLSKELLKEQQRHRMAQENIRKTEFVLQQFQANAKQYQFHRHKLQEELAYTRTQVQSQKSQLASFLLKEQQNGLQKEKSAASLKQAHNSLQLYQLAQIELQKDRDRYAFTVQQLQHSLNETNIQFNRIQQQYEFCQQQIHLMHQKNVELAKAVDEREEELYLMNAELQRAREMNKEVDEKFRAHEQNYLIQLEQLKMSHNQKTKTIDAKVQEHQLYNEELKEQIATLNRQKQQLMMKISNLEVQILENSIAFHQQDRMKSQLEQRLLAFEQEHHSLIARFEDTENARRELANRIELTQNLHHQKKSMEEEMIFQESQLRQIRALLQNATAREGQLQMQCQRRDVQLKDFQEERERQRSQYEVLINQLSRNVEELNQQIDHERGKLEEQVRTRQELLKEIYEVRTHLEGLGRDQENHQEIHSLLLKEKEKLEFQIHQNTKYLSQQESNWENMKLSLEEEINSLKRMNEDYHHELSQTRTSLQQQNQKIGRQYEQLLTKHTFQARQFEDELKELQALIIELRNQKDDLHHKLESVQTISTSNHNDLASYTFNHFERQEPESPNKLKSRIYDLEVLLEQYKAKQEEFMRLSYSKTFENSYQETNLDGLRQENALLSKEIEQLSTKVRQLQVQIKGKDEEILRVHETIITYQSQLLHTKQEIQIKDNELHSYLEQAASNQILVYTLNKKIEQIQIEHQEVQRSYNQKQTYILNQELNSSSKQKLQLYEQQILELKRTVTNMRNNIKNQEIEQIETLKGQLTKYTLQIEQLNMKINLLTSELQQAHQQTKISKQTVIVVQRQLEEYETKRIQTEKRQSRIQPQFDNQHRILSRLSKRSSVSANVDQPQSSDGQLSRRILNDPSKISGQQSKFAHQLVFQNSKIHVIREMLPQPIKSDTEIKQHQEESVLSKQIQENRVYQSSNRQISTTNHFDRSSNDNSKKQVNEVAHEEEVHSSKIDELAASKLQHSQTSIKKVEEVHDKPLNQSQISAELNEKPKEYLPQQSSKKTISNNSSKKNIPESVNQIIFQKNSITYSTSPLYIAQPLIRDQNIQRRDSQSRSGSKTKIRISYGQTQTDKSIQIKRRQITNSQIFRQNIMPTDHPINEMSPVPLRASEAKSRQPSIFSSHQNVSRLTIQNEVERPSESIINGMNMASKLSAFGVAHRQSSILNYKQQEQKQSIYIPSRINDAHSPRHSNIIQYPIRNPSVVYTQPRTSTWNQETNVRRETLIQSLRLQESRKNSLPGPQKIVMRSVIGGKRNSLLSDTPSFGRNSQHAQLAEHSNLSESNDSGIDVLQVDWSAPCCKNQ